MNIKIILFTLALNLSFNLAFNQAAMANDNGAVSNFPSEALSDIEHPSEDVPSLADVMFHKAHIENEIGKDIESNAQILSGDSLMASYSHIDPKRMIPSGLLKKALSVYHSNKASFANKNYLTIVNFSARSNLKRMFLIDMKSGQVQAVRTAHGAGGDRDHDGRVESLGNVPNSKKSSRGFYKVAEIYSGKYGRSIRLDGLSKSNSKARSRAIVIHGSNGVKEANVIQGRSWGCFSLAWSVKDSIVSRISGGSLLYADWNQ